MFSGIRNLQTVSPTPISNIFQSKFKKRDCITDTDADGFLPLEDELTQSYFAEHVTGPLPLSKEDISTLGKCLQKMLVLDPRNRAQTHVLLRDLWFTWSANSVR